MPGFKVTHVYLCTVCYISHTFSYLNKFKNNTLKSNYVFLAKLSRRKQLNRRCRDVFIYSLYIPHRDNLLCSQHSHQSSTFLTFINLQLCIIIIQSPWFMLGFTLGLCLIYFHIRQILMLMSTSPLKSIWDCVHTYKCFPLECRHTLYLDNVSLHSSETIIL